MKSRAICLYWFLWN